ncbi:LuxR family transcriptional regulator [Kineosporia sp. NBRC 101731]|uniref:ATP-binding protein n=1 Tax=Kineosporia sp. NBRC 101731 TaxID=3032199 RepID=UPI0025574725|nr:LuxR family transcriptional regulator [Kineosporia sp. NBRC 101731]
MRFIGRVTYPGTLPFRDVPFGLAHHLTQDAATEVGGAVAGVVTSPVLVGRDEFLALTGRRLVQAASGSGELLLVAGEAGIGKTRFLGAVARQARSLGFTVSTGAAFPGDSASSAGLLLDLAADLGEPTGLGRRLADRLAAITDDPARSGDAHHRRRMLVQDLVGLLLALREGGPRLIVLEDLHWADAVSLDVIGRLAPRLSSGSLLIAAAYRSDELYPSRPLRELRARLVVQRLAEEIRLPRLSLPEVSVLTGAVLGGPVPGQTVQALHTRSDGIPLHVEELLAAATTAGPPMYELHEVQEVAVPDTLAEAVLSRVRHLAPVTREVVRAAAVIGRSFDFDLLALITGLPDDEVAAALRELREAYLVLPGPDATTFDFRHALIRDALYADTDLPVRRRLHEQAARAAAGRGYRGAVVSAHFEHAGQAAPAHAHALAAAREATALSAHREALELYRRAARNAPDDLDVTARVALLSALGAEAAAVDENAEAAAAYTSAHALALESGDVRTAAALVPGMVAVGHLLGEPLRERVSRLRAATDLLDRAGIEATTERRALRSATAAAFMLDRRLDEAIDEGRGSAGSGPDTGSDSSIDAGPDSDDDVALNTSITLGSVLVFAGRPAEGWSLLEKGVRQARSARREAEAARGYRMLATTASVVVEYDRADHWLAEGVTYAGTVDLWNHRHYLAAHQGHVGWATGDWARAEATARQALADGRGGITTRITAQYVLGYLAFGRGEAGTADALLREALEAGRDMAELQRFSPPLWGLAEAARCRGDHDQAARLCEEGFHASAEVTDAAYLFPFLLTGVRAHLATGDLDAAGDFAARTGAVLRSRSIPGTLPALVHAEGLLLAAQATQTTQTARADLAGARARLEKAVHAWSDRRRFWESCWGKLDLADVCFRMRRRAEANRYLDEVRAQAGAAGATVLLTAAGRLTPVTSRTPWHPLTAREFEVARLIADGLTNRQIAEHLVLAPKTVSAHVEHILAKLGAARRTEIASWTAGVNPRPRS